MRRCLALLKRYICSIFTALNAAFHSANAGIRRAMMRFRHRQMEPVEAPKPIETQHVCKHCGYAFVGRQCPMCGMPGGWERFTWHRLVYGFLDIWGLGNRPMFRSMGHLLWRPGYMIRDYLSGHYLSYFPPFKMLAVLTVFVAFTMWLLGIDLDSTHTALTDAQSSSADNWLAYLNPALLKLFRQVRDFFYGNALYRLLAQIVFLVLAVWIVFRKQGLNLVETFFAMVYISCQMQIVTIVWLLLTRLFSTNSIFPYALPETLVLVLLMLDFRQLYHMRLWSAIWRMLLACLLLVVFYTIMLFLIVLIFIAGGMWSGRL